MDMISGLRYEAERRKKQEADAKAARDVAAHGVAKAAESEDDGVIDDTDSAS